MDFELSEEQQLLKQTCERYFADHYQFESRKRYAHEPRGWSLIAWKQYADLGLLGVPFAEEHGGTGRGPVETMIGLTSPPRRAATAAPMCSTAPRRWCCMATRRRSSWSRRASPARGPTATAWRCF